MALEVELKFTAHEAFDLEATLKRLGEVYALEPREDEQHRDVYVDTQDDELRRAGLASRVRTHGERVQVQLKTIPLSETVMSARTELAFACESLTDGLRRVAEHLEQAHDFRLRRELDTRVVLDKHRRRWCLRDAEGLAELAFDTVTVETGSDEKERFCELEVELVEGRADWLERVAKVLHDAKGLEPSGKSKLDRARAVLGRENPLHPAVSFSFDPDTPLVLAAKRVLARQLDAIWRYEAGTRLGLDPQYLHKMRVATRRLRTAAMVFEAALPEGERRQLAKDAKWLGRRLGELRELDAFAAALPRWQALFGEKPRGGWRAVQRHLDRRRARARRRVVRAIASERYASLLSRGAALVVEDEADLASVPVSKSASACVAPYRDALGQARSRFTKKPTMAAAHRLRLAAKRLRYALEFFAPLELASGTQMRALRRFQDRLGELQDLSEAGEWARSLRKAITSEHADERLVFVLGKLSGAAAGASVCLRSSVLEALDQLGPDISA